MGFLDKLLGRSNELKNKAGKYADQYGDKIGEGLDKAGDTANKATKGRFEGQIDKAKGAAKDGVSRLGEQGGGTDGQAPGGHQG
ncbi:antitoxin [Janibacter corallicola]|uniref:antitoxin n=1 Tax=Janibacter corallicola TaxID=415212 RepID=UPI00082ACC86|nr:antitoxin [Janibacter corallicola]